MSEWLISLIIGIGAALLGIGFSVIWHGKSEVRKPGKKVKGKYQYYTNGQVWLMKLKADWNKGRKGNK